MIFIFRYHKVSTMALTGNILVLIGIAFAVVGGLIAGYTQLSLGGTVSTEGTILSCVYPEGSCQPTVSFRTPEGRLVSFHSSMSSSSLGPGALVMVRYEASDPQNAQIDPSIGSEHVALIFAGIGLLMALMGLCLFLAGGNHPSAALVNQYYAAIKSRDYITAFQYLDITMRGAYGQPLTPDWFVERALVYDVTEGRMTSDAITSFVLNQESAKFTVRVTRSNGAYNIHVDVVNDDDTWRISGFDRF